MLFRADKIGAAGKRLQAGNLRHQLRIALFDRCLDLGKGGVNDLLLMGQDLLLFGQSRKEAEPHQGVFL